MQHEEKHKTPIRLDRFLSFRVPDELDQSFRAECESRSESVSTCLRRMVEEHVSRQERR